MIWLTGGQIYDVEAGGYRRGEIAIDDEGRIEGITATASPAPDDEVIDVDGAFLLPGLIDCHVHLVMPTWVADPAAAAARPEGLIAIHAAVAAERSLMAGFTALRDVGGWNYHEMAVRSAIEAGLIRGPRLFLAGRILSITTGGAQYYPGMYEVADGVEEVMAAARKQIAMGADLIKVMATGAMLSPESEDSRAIQFRPEELAAAVAIARDNYKPVAAHAHACQGIVNAVEAGVDSIEHGTFADDEALALMADRGTFLVPTCCVAQAMLADDAVATSMPQHLTQRLLEFDAIHHEAVRRAHALGVPIAMGTDAGTPGNHHGDNAQEIVQMVRDCGLTPAEAIQAATLNGARLLRQADNLGSLEPGKYADIIGLNGDPLDDIEELRRVAFVMKGGVVVKDELDE
ncbi:MAG: amidohydrolase family protein [Kiloniellales bacterium]